MIRVHSSDSVGCLLNAFKAHAALVCALALYSPNLLNASTSVQVLEWVTQEIHEIEENLAAIEQELRTIKEAIPDFKKRRVREIQLGEERYQLTKRHRELVLKRGKLEREIARLQGVDLSKPVDGFALAKEIFQSEYDECEDCHLSKIGEFSERRLKGRLVLLDGYYTSVQPNAHAFHPSTGYVVHDGNCYARAIVESLKLLPELPVFEWDYQPPLKSDSERGECDNVFVLRGTIADRDRIIPVFHLAKKGEIIGRHRTELFAKHQDERVAIEGEIDEIYFRAENTAISIHLKDWRLVDSNRHQ